MADVRPIFFFVWHGDSLTPVTSTTAIMQALLEELELSLPFRESALQYVRHNMPDDDRIEDILGVTAARHHPESVLKVRRAATPSK